jgi:hypothetical protein
MDAIIDVYDAQREAIQALPELGGESSSEDPSKPPKKKQRGSTSSSSAAAMETFKEVMLQSSQATIPIQQQNLPKNVKDFFEACGLKPEQKKSVYQVCGVEDGAEPSIVMLCSFDDAIFEELENPLTAIQRRTWKLLASKLL